MDAPMSALLSRLTAQYLASGKRNDFADFNGVEAARLKEDLGYEEGHVRELLREAVQNNFVVIITKSIFVNPHVKPTDEIPVEKQLGEIERPLSEIYVYPTSKHMESVIELSEYPPYSLQLALGKGVRDVYYFKPEVLNLYWEAPDKYDMSKSSFVLVKSSHYDSLGEEEQSECFGTIRYIGRRKTRSGNELVSMALCYLAELPVAEQNHWREYEVLAGLQEFLPNTKEDDEAFWSWYHGTIHGWDSTSAST